ncbi:Uncharacterised protein [Vibrio cholerae]|nr:Uncharacterised protein [Vibrio cholerae]
MSWLKSTAMWCALSLRVTNAGQRVFMRFGIQWSIAAISMTC